MYFKYYYIRKYFITILLYIFIYIYIYYKMSTFVKTINNVTDKFTYIKDIYLQKNV